MTRSVRRLVCRSVGLPVKVSKKGEKLHFHAPIGALVLITVLILILILIPISILIRKQLGYSCKQNKECEVTKHARNRWDMGILHDKEHVALSHEPVVCSKKLLIDEMDI